MLAPNKPRPAGMHAKRYLQATLFSANRGDVASHDLGQRHGNTGISMYLAFGDIRPAAGQACGRAGAATK
jgi:hypothetical protein